MKPDQKLAGAITILVSKDETLILIEDKASGTEFVRVKLTTEQFCQALSRLACTPCEILVGGLEDVGKQMHMDDLVFEMPKHDFRNRKKIACEEAKKVCPAGWTPDLYFGSQTSFWKQDGKQFARTTIRKWE